MKAVLLAIVLAGVMGSASAASTQVPDRVSIFTAPPPAGEFIKACRGCGCRGGSGIRLPNGKCA